MQPYCYVTHSYSIGTTPVSNYRQNTIGRGNSNALQPLGYPSESSTQSLSLPLIPTVSHRQSQPLTYAQTYFYNLTTQTSVLPKKISKENKTQSSTNPLNGIQNQGMYNSFSTNDITDDLLKLEGTKVKLLKNQRKPKLKSSFQYDTSDDEFEQILFDTPRSQILSKPKLQIKRPLRKIQRRSSIASSSSHCSTCTDCSCSKCHRQKKRVNIYSKRQQQHKKN